MALAKIVGLAVTPRIPSATSRLSVPSRRYTRVRLSSQGLWPCSWYRRWSLVMASFLSSVVAAREHVSFGLVPHRMVAGGLDVEAVVVDKTAAKRRTHRHQQTDDNRQDRDPGRGDRRGVIVVQPPGDVGQGEHGDGNHDRGVGIDRAPRLGAGLRGLPPVPE